MRFPNLIWAASHRGMTHFRLAANAGLSEARFSRGLNGRVEFRSNERKRISEVLGYDEGWLFRETLPPGRPELKEQGNK
jgi:transcriptional regulator with XRE-family HTH domain